MKNSQELEWKGKGTSTKQATQPVSVYKFKRQTK